VNPPIYDEHPGCWPGFSAMDFMLMSMSWDTCRIPQFLCDFGKRQDPATVEPQDIDLPIVVVISLI